MAGLELHEIVWLHYIWCRILLRGFCNGTAWDVWFHCMLHLISNASDVIACDCFKVCFYFHCIWMLEYIAWDVWFQIITGFSAWGCLISVHAMFDCLHGMSDVKWTAGLYFSARRCLMSFQWLYDFVAWHIWFQSCDYGWFKNYNAWIWCLISLHGFSNVTAWDVWFHCMLHLISMQVIHDVIACYIWFNASDTWCHCMWLFQSLFLFPLHMDSWIHCMGFIACNVCFQIISGFNSWGCLSLLQELLFCCMAYLILSACDYVWFMTPLDCLSLFMYFLMSLGWFLISFGCLI